jgi:hypothetical protein
MGGLRAMRPLMQAGGPPASARPVDLATVLLVALPAVSLIPKYFLIIHTLSAGADIVQTGFGFGDYIRSLLTDGSFRSCAVTPFAHCMSGTCNYATRMPLLPLIYVGLARLVGTGAIPVALAKCTLGVGLLEGFLLALIRDVRLPLRAVALAYGLYLGPQALKHAVSLEYEEGLMVDLEACLAVAAGYLLLPELTSSARKRRVMVFSAVVLATALYFIKTTALLTLIGVLALVVMSAQVGWRIKALALFCTALPLAAWVSHNYAVSGVLSFSSSWNGENLYRGSSAEGLALYPQVSLDRLFDSKQARLLDGRIQPLGNLAAQRCFANEWAWSDYYARQARAWVQQQPAAAIRFEGQKIWVGLLELRHTPYRVAAEGPESEYPPLVAAAMLVWMGFARLVFFALLALIVLDMRRGHLGRSLWVLALIAAGWIPYLAVFSYQRHLVPLLIMDGLLLIVLYTGQLRVRDSQSESASAVAARSSA